LKAGLDPGLIRAAVSELEGEIAALRAHRARLESWRDESAAEGDRMHALRDLAEAAQGRLSSMEPREQRAVLDLLDVRVTVTGWRPCEACDGKGKVRGGRGGLPCGSCRATRRTSSLRIEGAVLDKRVRDGVLRVPPSQQGPVARLPFRAEVTA